LLDAENNYNITCADMGLMLGIGEGTVLLPDTNTYQAPPDAGSIAQWQTTAFKSRKDVAAISERQQAATAAIKSTKGEYYPGVAVTGGYIAADIHNILTITNALNLGLGLQYNIGSIWKTGAKVDAATARLHELQATDAILRERIDLQVNQAFHNYILSQRKIEVYGKAVEQSAENYRITKNKHDNNLVTTTELLEADIAQLQASLNYTFAKVDAVLAYNKLQQASGTLLSTYRSNK
jgi:outer membrane protein